MRLMHFKLDESRIAAFAALAKSRGRTMQGQFLLAIDAALAASKPPESRVYTHVEPSKTDVDSWIDVWLSREFEEPEGE